MFRTVSSQTPIDDVKHKTKLLALIVWKFNVIILVLEA